MISQRVWAYMCVCVCVTSIESIFLSLLVLSLLSIYRGILLFWFPITNGLAVNVRMLSESTLLFAITGTVMLNIIVKDVRLFADIVFNFREVRLLDLISYYSCDTLWWIPFFYGNELIVLYLCFSRKREQFWKKKTNYTEPVHKSTNLDDVDDDVIEKLQNGIFPETETVSTLNELSAHIRIFNRVFYVQLQSILNAISLIKILRAYSFCALLFFVVQMSWFKFVVNRWNHSG